MGRNNRQRRAAKQKSRARRGPTPPRPARSEAELIDELIDDLCDMLGGLGDPDGTGDGDGDGDGEGFPFDPWPPTVDHRPHAPSGEDRARALLDGLLRWARTTSGDALTDAVHRSLEAEDPHVLSRLDVLVSRRLLTGVANLWERGWQPRDLVHVVGRLDKWAGPIAADVAVEQAGRSGHADGAPQPWLDQLEDATRRARSAGVGVWPGADEWLAVNRVIAAGGTALAAWTSVVRVLAQLETLPPLTPTLPPPSAWRAGTDGRARRVPPTGPRRTGPSKETGPDRDKVLSTIRALLAKAESTDFAAEAEALTAKAQALMTRHAIDEALLHAASDDPVDVISRRVHIDSPYPLEKTHLLSAVGRANRAKVIWMEDLAMATVVGTPVDVDQAELLFVSLLIQATRAMAEAGAARPGSFDRSPRFRRSFLTSYAVRIGERLAEADAEATSSYGSELVPVLRRQAEAVEDEFERLFPHTRDVSSRRTYDRRGWDAGRQAADAAVFVAGRIAG